MVLGLGLDRFVVGNSASDVVECAVHGMGKSVDLCWLAWPSDDQAATTMLFEIFDECLGELAQSVGWLRFRGVHTDPTGDGGGETGDAARTERDAMIGNGAGRCGEAFKLIEAIHVVACVTDSPVSCEVPSVPDATGTLVGEISL